jgi:hypothetical protein
LLIVEDPQQSTINNQQLTEFGMKPVRLFAAVLVMVCAAERASAWSHQGHVMITQLACLRILNDPKAPQGLKDFIRANTSATMEEVEKLALKQTLGTPRGEINHGIDGYCTLPDRILSTPEGKEPIEPYGVAEALMHFTDLEYFTKQGWYYDDMSGRPKMEEIPHDVTDPRWKRAGFVPLRIEECYKKLVKEFAKGKEMDNEAAAKWAGYLAHYTEDIRQPHHTTADHKSFSYLAGKVPGVPESAAHTDPRAAHVDRSINPHGDVEFQLFANAEQPRASIRRIYWRDLVMNLDRLGSEPAALQKPGEFDPFHSALTTMYDSYEYLPLVGRAAVEAYQSGAFDPQAFFTYEYAIHGQKLSVVQMIAQQNAKAVLSVEQIWRQAWADAQAE